MVRSFAAELVSNLYRAMKFSIFWCNELEGEVPVPGLQGSVGLGNLRPSLKKTQRQNQAVSSGSRDPCLKGWHGSAP